MGGYSVVNAATSGDPVDPVEPWALGDAERSIRSLDVDESRRDRESEEDSDEDSSPASDNPATSTEVTPNADGTLPDNYREDIPEFTPDPEPSPGRGGGGGGGGEELTPDELPPPDEGVPSGEFGL